MKGFVSFMKIKMFILTFELIPWLWFWRKFTRKYLKSTYFSAFIGFDKDVCSNICCLKLNHATVKQQNKCWLKKIVKSCGASRSFAENSKVDLIFLFFSFHWIWQGHLLQNLLPQAESCNGLHWQLENQGWHRSSRHLSQMQRKSFWKRENHDKVRINHLFSRILKCFSMNNLLVTSRNENTNSRI